MSLTDLEREALEVLLLLKSNLEKKLTRLEFMEFMGHVRDTIKHLENKHYGCPTGRHSSTFCDCKKGEI